MKHSIFIILALLVFACSSKVYEGTKWQSNAVHADGEFSEWKLPLKYFDKTTQLNYEISNDSKNLYIAARTSDKTTSFQIFSSGLKIEIDTTDVGKVYPITTLPAFASFVQPVLDG